MSDVFEAIIFGFFWFTIIFVSCGSMYVIFNVCLVMILRKIVNEQEEQRRNMRRWRLRCECNGYFSQLFLIND